MQEKKILIINKLGLHARAASKLVSLTTRYSSQVEIIHNEKKINGKSIMGLLMLAASKGTELTIVTRGEDEIDLINSIEELINNKFDENE